MEFLDGKSIKDLEIQPVKDDEIILDWLFLLKKEEIRNLCNDIVKILMNVICRILGLI